MPSANVLRVVHRDGDAHAVHGAEARAECAPSLPRRTGHCLIFAALALTLAVVAGPTTVRARDVQDTDGAALDAGLGMPGLSLSASYYLQWPQKRLSLRPHVGAAWPEGVHPSVGAYGGVSGTFGRRHRLVVDVHAAPYGVTRHELYGATLDKAITYGIGALVGYEWLDRSGFFIRAGVGVAYCLLPPLLPRSEGWGLALNLAEIGVKLW